MHSLVMSPCLCDLIVMSLVVKLIGAWFLDSELSTCFELTWEQNKYGMPNATNMYLILMKHQTEQNWTKNIE